MIRARDRGRPAHYQDPAVVARYHERFTRPRERFKVARESALLGRWLADAPSVLEVACGPGRFFEQTGRRGYVGLDFSRAMLDEFRRHHGAVPIVRGDAGQLPFPDGAFDTVVCSRFVTHLRGEFRARVLRELARVARRHVIFDGRHRYNLRFVSRWVRRRLGLAHADKLRSTCRQTREELEAAGLEIRERRSIAWGLSARFMILATPRSPS